MNFEPVNLVRKNLIATLEQTTISIEQILGTSEIREIFQYHKRKRTGNIISQKRYINKNKYMRNSDSLL